MIKAGTALVDITPEPGVQLAGYPHCPRPNEGAHDRLYAAALYMDDGQESFCIITADILSIGKDITRELRRRTGKNILINATHTHSGAWGSETLASEHEEGIVRNPEYAAILLDRLEEAVSSACGNTFSARVGTYVGKCGTEQGVGGNRLDPKGLADDSVNVLGVKDCDGVVRAVLVNYSLHPTYLHADNVLASADYPAYIRKYFAFAKRDAVVMFGQGTSGNQSSRYFRTAQNYEEAARAGTTIAVEADRCLGLIDYREDIRLSVHSFEIDDMPMKAFPSVEEALSTKIEAEALFESAKDKDYITMRNAELRMFGAQNTYGFSKLAANGYVSPELPYEIMTVTVGDTVIVGLQGELFVEYGLRIKQISPYEKTFVLGVSNGYAPGYIYTPEEGASNGYEAGTSMFAPDAGEHIIKNLRREWNV